MTDEEGIISDDQQPEGRRESRKEPSTVRGRDAQRALPEPERGQEGAGGCARYTEGKGGTEEIAE